MPDSTPPGTPRQPIDPTGTSTPPPPPPGYVPAVYVQHPGGGKGAGKIVMYLLFVALLVSVTFNVYLFGPVRTIAAAISGTVKEQPYNPEFDVTSDQERIVVVHLAGFIDAPTAAHVRNSFYRLTLDPPAAVVLRVESGGGLVTPSDQMWHAIKEFKAEHPEIPVVASFGGLAASGGYYAAAPCDYIFCERSTVTGSIGVIATLPAAGKMVEKFGLEVNVVVADGSPNKADGNNLFADWYDDDGDLTEEGSQSLATVKNLVNQHYATFLSVVKEGRKAADSTITDADIEAAATGAVFIGQQAIDAKIVDELGYLDDAIEYAAKQAKITGEPRVFSLYEPVEGGLLGSLVKSPDAVNLNNLTGDGLRQILDDATAVRLEYRMRLR